MSLVSLRSVCGANGHMSLVFFRGKHEFDAFVEKEINGALSTSFTVKFSVGDPKSLLLPQISTLLCYFIYYN